MVLLCVMAQAQTGLSGKWTESTPSGLNAELDQSHGHLAGRHLHGPGSPATITDGKVTKNSFTFKANLEGQPEGFSGELNGDAIVLWRDRNGKVDALTLKRAATSLTGKWQGQTLQRLQPGAGSRRGSGADRHPHARRRSRRRSPVARCRRTRSRSTATLDGAAETVEGTVDNNEMKAWLTRGARARSGLEAGEMTNRRVTCPTDANSHPEGRPPASDRPILAPALFQHYPLRHPSRVDRPDRERDRRIADVTNESPSKTISKILTRALPTLRNECGRGTRLLGYEPGLIVENDHVRARPIAEELARGFRLSLAGLTRALRDLSDTRRARRR